MTYCPGSNRPIVGKPTILGRGKCPSCGRLRTVKDGPTGTPILLVNPHTVSIEPDHRDYPWPR